MRLQQAGRSTHLNLAGEEIRDADLNHLQLRGANLSRANHSGANLSGVDLGERE
ncbi:MAG: pentapeptide repeat-containing protein [Ktedonobacteraceae bacterium]|nr:pentapeptide repeat-containing protein [Ktedonobacteraceae bacterium]